MRNRTPQTKDAAKGGGYALNKSKQLKQKNDNHVGVPIFLQRFPTKYYQSHVIQNQVEEPENVEGPIYHPKLNLSPSRTTPVL